MRHITNLAGALLLAGAAGVAGAAGAAAQTAAAPATAPLTTATLANLCVSPGGEGDLDRAVGFCRGFLIGAGQYHTEITRPGGRASVFCLPNPAPTIEAAQASFVAWAAANPDRANDKAVDGLLRWAAATWPCPAPAARPARR